MLISDTPLVKENFILFTQNFGLTIVVLIKVWFCPRKRMSPPVPQTVVKGKKIYLGNKSNQASMNNKKKCF